MEGGRRRDAGETKARLLEAAQAAFGQDGYTGTGIRDIAARAGVNSALLARYFGSKAAIFEAALIASLNLEGLILMDRSDFGARLGRHLLDVGHVNQLMFAVPTNDAVSAGIVARVTETHAIQPLAAWLGPPDARARALKIVMLASAACLYVRHSKLTIDTADEASIREWFAASVQAIVDGAGEA